MIIDLTASAVRSRAKRAGFLNAITIRSGENARQAEQHYVAEYECSVRIAVMAPGVEEWLSKLPLSGSEVRDIDAIPASERASRRRARTAAVIATRIPTTGNAAVIREKYEAIS